jgi:hypothetical protein
MIQPLSVDQLEEIAHDLQRELREAQELLKEHEARLNDLYLWVAAIGEDMIERTQAA